jgi:hypothetical protein
MRRKDKEITDKHIIQDILSKSEICRIALTDGESPYIVPLNYGFFENTFYFHSASTGKKIDIIKKNNRVCFEIEYSQEIVRQAQSCNWTTKYRSVIGFGNIEILTDPEQKKKGLDIIMAHYGKPDNNQYIEADVERIVILKLVITEVSGKQSGDWDVVV